MTVLEYHPLGRHKVVRVASPPTSVVAVLVHGVLGRRVGAVRTLLTVVAPYSIAVAVCIAVAIRVRTVCRKAIAAVLAYMETRWTESVLVHDDTTTPRTGCHISTTERRHASSILPTVRAAQLAAAEENVVAL